MGYRGIGASGQPTVLPEWFGAGNLSGSDGTLINDAIQSLANRNQAGKILLSGKYALDVPIQVLPGVVLEWTGGAGWESSTADWTGYCCPASSFSGSQLVAVGTANNQGGNPDGGRLLYPCLLGKTPAGAVVSGLSGVVVTDTANFEIYGPSIRYMDNGGTTGMGVRFYATIASGTVDCKVIGGILHGNAIPIDIDNAVGVTAGTTDCRVIGTSIEPLGSDSACGVRLGNSGATSAGSGTFLTDVHITLGSSSSGHDLLIGAGVKKTIATACYFDVCEGEQISNAGTGLQIANCYFQASTNQATPSFINQQETSATSDLSPDLSIVGSTFYPGGVTTIVAIAQLSSRTNSHAPLLNATGNKISGQGSATSHIGGIIVDSTGAAYFATSGTSCVVANNVYATS